MFFPNLPWSVDVEDRAFPNPETDYHSFSVKISIPLIPDLFSLLHYFGRNYAFYMAGFMKLVLMKFSFLCTKWGQVRNRPWLKHI